MAPLLVRLSSVQVREDTWPGRGPCPVRAAVHRVPGESGTEPLQWQRVGQQLTVTRPGWAAPQLQRCRPAAAAVCTQHSGRVGQLAAGLPTSCCHARAWAKAAGLRGVRLGFGNWLPSVGGSANQLREERQQPRTGGQTVATSMLSREHGGRLTAQPLCLPSFQGRAALH